MRGRIKTRLRDRNFDPPRKRDFLTRSLVVAFNDRRQGTQNGRADAVGHGMTDAEGVLHAERLIDAQAERAAADQRCGLHASKEEAQKIHQSAALDRDHADRETTYLNVRDTELAEQEAALGRRHGLGPISYGLVLGALFCLTFPIDYGVASWLSLPPLGQWLLAVFIGVAVLIGAHETAKKIEELEESYAERERQPFTYRKDQLALAVALGMAIFVLVVTTIWRGQLFASEAQATGTPVSGGIASLALGALAALAFVLAVLAGMNVRRMAPLRAIRQERAQLSTKRASWQTMADRSARAQHESVVTLVYLNEREQRMISAIGHWADERKARLRQRTAWVSMKERRKLAATSFTSPIGTDVSTDRPDITSPQLNRTADAGRDFHGAR